MKIYITKDYDFYIIKYKFYYNFHHCIYKLRRYSIISLLLYSLAVSNAS